MNPFLKGLFVSGVFAVLAVVFWVTIGKGVKREAPPPAGYSLLNKFETEGVPDFSAPLIKQGIPTGADMSLSEYKGKIIILSFWATWCAPCIEEFPSMVALVERFKGDIVMIGVSADQRTEDIESFLQTYKLNTRFFVNLWDPSTKIAESYGTYKIPENYIIGQDLKLLKKVTAVRDWNSEDVVAYFENLLASRKEETKRQVQ